MGFTIDKNQWPKDKEKEGKMADIMIGAMCEQTGEIACAIRFEEDGSMSFYDKELGRPIDPDRIRKTPEIVLTILHHLGKLMIASEGKIVEVKTDGQD